jgi:uroporphyrinogen decarboxylase
MTPRERIEKALSHKETDRIPIDLGGPQTTIELFAYRNLLNLLNVKTTERVFLRAHSIPDEKILELFQIDTRYIYFKEPQTWDSNNTAQMYFDEWGKKWKLTTRGFYYEMIGSPLQNSNAEIEDIHSHKWPVDSTKRDIERWRKQSKNLYEKSHYFIVGDSIGWGIFEESWGIRGLENFLIDLMTNKKFAEALMDKVLETQIKRFEQYLKEIGSYIGAICISDDIAGQDGPIISPDLYRKMIKPRHVELIRFIKSMTDAKIFFHCCGDVIPFLEDFIDIGVDIINPVQVSAGEMGNTSKLKKIYGDRLVFWGGGCDSQQILPYGSKLEIEREVKRRIEDLAAGGGFIFAPVHNIQPDVPPENIVALYKAALKHGL